MFTRREKDLEGEVKLSNEQYSELWDIVNDLDSINHPINNDETWKVSKDCFDRLLKLAREVLKLAREVKEKNS